MSKISGVTEEQLSEYKEVFGLFDKKGNGFIETDVLGDVLRSCGQNPTNAQVSEIINSLQDKNQKPISFDTFLEIVTRPDGFKAPGLLEDYIAGFAVFDKDGTGYISAAELRYVLTQMGEKLSECEVDELLKHVEVSKEGLVAYEDFVKTVTTG